MDKIKDLFVKKYQKTGVALTASQLLGYVKKNRKAFSSSPLTSQLGDAALVKQIYQFLREEVPELGPFARADKRPKHFQTIGVSKAGVYFIDYAEFHKSWAKSNNNCTGFLLAVENLTNKVFVLPSQGKDTRQWLNSIAQFVELTRDVQVIYSDRDSVAKSLAFRAELGDKYGLNWHFLKKGNKSYLAERYIGFFKTKLSQALATRHNKDGSPYKRWVDFVPELCKEYNSQVVPGTSFKRGGITKDNFDIFVGQLFGEKDPELSRYNSFKAGPFQNERWNRACFKFQLGDKVRVARSSNWKNKVEHGTGFKKVSIEGGFGNNLYTVAGRQLRANRTFDRFVPVYSLAEFGPEHFHFYENELSRSSQHEDDGSGVSEQHV